MDIEATARRIRERLMNRIEAERAIHASSIEAEIADVLRSVMSSQPLKVLAPLVDFTVTNADLLLYGTTLTTMDHAGVVTQIPYASVFGDE